MSKKNEKNAAEDEREKWNRLIDEERVRNKEKFDEFNLLYEFAFGEEFSFIKIIQESDQLPCQAPVTELPEDIRRGSAGVVLSEVKGISSTARSSKRLSAENGSHPETEKAKREVNVPRRTVKTQKQNVRSEKRLPKVWEPPRTKTHWDYVLEEVRWISTDFSQEYKWKRNVARKCARMVQKCIQEKESSKQKVARMEELQTRKVASQLAKLIKTFWSNVEKFIEYKQHLKLEEKRKMALDEHLSFIVDQTERYSTLVAETMNKPSLQVSSTNADDSEKGGKARRTVRGTKRICRKKPTANEEVPTEVPKNVDSDYNASSDSDDDETTIMKQEALEGDVDHKKEIATLEEESNMPLEELLKKYAGRGEGIEDNQSSDSSASRVNSDSGEDTGADSDEDNREARGGVDENNDSSEAFSDNGEKMEVDESDDDNEDASSVTSGTSSSSDIVTKTDVSLTSLLRSDQKTSSQNEESSKVADIDDFAAIAERIQPKGNTLSSTTVCTKVPSLLRHKLREYQHIGLDWLVTMYDHKLNGILADEMGLGKTIQTIALLAHLACVKGNWGPHLIIVPTSVMLNWEMEFKKWCPAFKILTYYGNPKERKLKRSGWTKNNTFHVCITSYKLVVQDHNCFRRKKWVYLILDEAHHIKNFKSQRWQTLLNYQTERRLLLTGTPLQNNLMELWSLMHFLMPDIFASHQEFKEWFSNPLTGIIEGSSEYNDHIIIRLHKILRPFLLRRLKADVEKQLPKKYEHVVMCRLSSRQRYLYDDFMCRARTREVLSSGNLCSVIGVLMQLRKVCNHPDLFEPRVVSSPLEMGPLCYDTWPGVFSVQEYDPSKDVNLSYLNLRLTDADMKLSVWTVHRLKKYRLTENKMTDILKNNTGSVPPVPKIPITFRLDIPSVLNSSKLPEDGTESKGTKRPNSECTDDSCTTINVTKPSSVFRTFLGVKLKRLRTDRIVTRQAATVLQTDFGEKRTNTSSASVQSKTRLPAQIQDDPKGSVSQTATALRVNSGRQQRTGVYIPKPIRISSRFIIKDTAKNDVTADASLSTPGGQKIGGRRTRHSSLTTDSPEHCSDEEQSTVSIIKKNRISLSTNLMSKRSIPEGTITKILENQRNLEKIKLQILSNANSWRTRPNIIMGSDVVEFFSIEGMPGSNKKCKRCCKQKCYHHLSSELSIMKQIKKDIDDIVCSTPRFMMYVPAVHALPPKMITRYSYLADTAEFEMKHLLKEQQTILYNRWPIVEPGLISLPDPRLVQYDCGKLQVLSTMLRKLKSQHHRCIVFTQMSKMLDILEVFLNIHGYVYLRLDGTTPVEQRQILMERFNADSRYFCFILSTRSGCLGVNLTGADTVIFYDSDWNPTMDAQAQDRCHRIGQTRDVHIYRLISERTVEENILKKAGEKRLLGDIAIEGGNFTAAYFKKSTIRDIFGNTGVADSRKQSAISNTANSVQDDLSAYENLLSTAEDEQDIEAAKIAKEEASADLAEFDENVPFAGEGGDLTGKNKVDQELDALVSQITPVEQWAVRFMETTDAEWIEEQSALAEAEIEQQKKEWEIERMEASKINRQLKVK